MKSRKPRLTLRINPQSPRALRSCALFSAKLSKRLALFGKLFQQGGGLPDFPMFTLKFGNAIVNLFQSHRVGIPHRSAAMRGETVTVDINNVDVGSTQRDALLQNARPFVHQSVEAAIGNFVRRDFSLRNFGFFHPLAD